MEGYYFGSMGNDVLTSNEAISFMAGLGGDDLLYSVSWTRGMVFMHGGSGNDTYQSNTVGYHYIADTQGNDTLTLEATKSRLLERLNDGDAGHAMVDGKHYFVMTSDTTAYLIYDFWGAGGIENIRYGDHSIESFQSLIDLFGPGNMVQLTSNALGIESEMALIEEYVSSCSFAEVLYQGRAAPAWFDENLYFERHYAKYGNGVSQADHMDAFIKSSFIGKDGMNLHFQAYGQWEDIAGTALFDADYYYQSKAADFYGKNISQVTSAETQNMQTAIQSAGMNAWNHYTLYGTREGIDASAAFDTSVYMEAKLAQMRQSDPNYTMEQLFAAFESAGLSAVEHYEAYGKAEGIQLVGVQSADAANAVSQDPTA